MIVPLASVHWSSMFHVFAHLLVLCCLLLRTNPVNAGVCEGSFVWDGNNPALVISRKLESSFSHVIIDRERIRDVILTMAKEHRKVEIPEWNYPPYLQSEDPVELANFLLVLNAINYSFFDPKSGVPFKHGSDYGATLATKRIVESWPLISNPSFLRNITNDFAREKLFYADTPISLLSARTAALREVGEFLYQQGPGGILGWIKSLGTTDAGAIAVALPLELPSWRDPMLKRAQLFLGMLFGRFQNRPDNPIDRKSLSQLVAFADYRLPQTLRAMEILKLSPADDRSIEHGELIAPGSDLEWELRAASILAADDMVDVMNELGAWGEVSILEVDYLLWSVGRAIGKGLEMPGIIVRKATEHHTVTTDY